MALELQNLADKKQRLAACDTAVFTGVDGSFRYFLRRLKVNPFRHIEDLEIDFVHPVTVISGMNKIGKTSLLLLIACSFERFLKVDSTSPAGQLREHTWSDVLSFTTHENPGQDYSYELDWRVGTENRTGEGKRLATSQAWSGVRKPSSDTSRLMPQMLGQSATHPSREVRDIQNERRPERVFGAYRNQIFERTRMTPNKSLQTSAGPKCCVSQQP